MARVKAKVSRTRMRKKQRTANHAEPDARSKGFDHWARLSNEIVLLILHHLPQKDIVTVSMINKRFRDLSRDKSLWTRTELTLDYNDIKHSAGRCRKLVERCKKLTFLKITNTSEYKGPLNIMSVVIRAKKTLKSLELDSSIREWTQGALAELDQMKELRNLSMTYDINYPFEENVYRLRNLAKLEHIEVL